MRAYFESTGEGDRRGEIVTTLLSHPGNPGLAATAGYKVITLMPDDTGYPNLDALKAALYCIQARPPIPVHLKICYNNTIIYFYDKD